MTRKTEPVSLDHILLSRANSVREEVALESTMQSLALDPRSPIAHLVIRTSTARRRTPSGQRARTHQAAPG